MASFSTCLIFLVIKRAEVGSPYARVVVGFVLVERKRWAGC